jgi:hypothetical protein
MFANNRAISCRSVLAVVLILLCTTDLFAQTTSRGPGKGPAIKGTGSPFTHPQPPKPTVYSMNAIRPAYQVPELAEKHTWKLTSKVDGRDPPMPTDDVAIYSFANGRRVQMGNAKSGEEIILEDIRPVGKAIYYKYDWKAAPANKSGPTSDYWVSGSNIEYSGKK